ncbi:helix-turn-helix domain-containing protein [Bacteroides ovatus]|jgi:transcriptional regulator with XRE-family HTH domain|uniref:helix-turn-helix domain-containing protein n=1 Tax=Bacteroides ovatus TaxID=28116 RepID=UPI001F2E69E2|nr:helix-turn-helix transcriptional regulator [Bacteroides ovatus]MCE9231166.1 helix-turn-helix transcriptional regulator [Bacteroides ovatus]
MNRIKDILKERGITINELAEKMGLNRVTLSTQINGTANIASYEKIATALDVPMWQLFVSSQEVQEPGKNTITCPHCGKPIELEVK